MIKKYSKRSYRKKSPYKRRGKRMMRSRNSLISVKRTIYLENWTPSTASTPGFWRQYAPTLGNIPSVAEFTALFDQYKINGIKFTFRPRYDSFAGNDTVDTTLPGITNQGSTMMHVIVDPDSAVSPSGVYNSTNLNSFLENGSVRSYNGNKAINIYFKPKVNLDGTTRRVRAPWFQTGSTAIVHYGIHTFLQDVNLTGTFGQSFDVFVTYYMQFRSLK